MSNLPTKNIKKKNDLEQSPKLVIHQINQTSVDRTPKDIADVINSLRIAEAIHFPNRSRLLDIYAVVDLDGHFTGVWGKRRSATTSRKLIFINKDGTEIEALRELMQSKKFRDLKKLILDYIVWGVSAAQFIPGHTFDWEEIPKKHILIEKGVIKINQNDSDGRPYTDDPYIMVYGDKRTLGLMLKVSFYALIKKGNFADWAQYSEIFGQPIRIAKYDAFDDNTRIQLKQVLDESGSSLALMIPKQAEFDIMDGKTSNGNGELQERLKIACNNEISTIILGNTETTTNENGGSNAKAQIQDQGEDDLKDDDLAELLAYLNHDKFVSILASYGYPVEGGKFALQDNKDPQKAKGLVDTIAAIRNSGTPISDDYVYEATGIPKPDDYESLKAKTEENKTVFQQALNPIEKQPKIPEPEDQTDTLWNRLRVKLADFFDPAQ